MKFADIERGTLAITPCVLPGKKTREGGEVRVDLRVLDADDEARVLAGARGFAEARGSKDPKVGDPLFDLGVMAHTLLVAAEDVDSPLNARQPFFASEKEVLKLDRDSIALLYERHEAWQNENSPYVRELPAGELFSRIAMIAAAEDDGPFLELAPSTRSRWARITARLLVSSPELRLQLGWSSPPATPTTSEEHSS